METDSSQQPKQTASGKENSVLLAELERISSELQVNSFFWRGGGGKEGEEFHLSLSLELCAGSSEILDIFIPHFSPFLQETQQILRFRENEIVVLKQQLQISKLQNERGAEFFFLNLPLSRLCRVFIICKRDNSPDFEEVIGFVSMVIDARKKKDSSRRILLH